MPLIVNYKDIPFWQDKFLIDTEEGKRESPWVFAIGLMSMHTGINRITTDNAPEFYARAKLVELCTGPLLVGPDGPVSISYEVLERFIGVTTNASSYTEAQFYQHLRKDLAHELRDQYEHERTFRAKEIADSLGVK